MGSNSKIVAESEEILRSRNALNSYVIFAESMIINESKLP